MKRYVTMALAAISILMGTLNMLFAGVGGIDISPADRFRTKAITLERFSLAGKNHPAGTYSFEAIGTGRPGVLKVRVLDSKGQVIGQLPGQFAGKCPGKPTKTSFAELGFSGSSNVRAERRDGTAHVNVECGRGSRIEFSLPQPNVAAGRN